MTDRERLASLLVEQIHESGPMFFHAAFSVLKHPRAAEDACQQAFMKAWQKADQLQDPSALRAWLARVVVNESLSMLRRRKRDRQAWANLGRERGPQPPVDHVELRESVVAALAQLDEQTQTVVTFRLMYGLAGNQVAQIIGCSATQVSRRLHQGLESLRRSLADYRSIINR